MRLNDTTVEIVIQTLTDKVTWLENDNERLQRLARTLGAVMSAKSKRRAVRAAADSAQARRKAS